MNQAGTLLFAGWTDKKIRAYDLKIIENEEENK